MNFATFFHTLAERWPDTVALIDAASGRQWRFPELAAEIRARAAALAANDLRQGDRVALLDDGSPDYVFADYAAMAGGFVRVPLDPSLAAEELLAQLLDAEAALLLFSARHEATVDRIKTLAPRSVASTRLEDLAPAAAQLDGAAAASTTAPGGDVAGQDIASLNYSGGTTGAPKAIVHTQESLLAAVRNVVLVRNIRPGETLVNIRPLWPIAALVVLGHLAAGGTVVLGGTPHFSAPHLAELLRRHRAVTTSLVPTHLVRLLRDIAPSGLRFPDLRFIDIGAAALPDGVMEHALAVLGPRLAGIYGLTEAPWSCYRAPADWSDMLRAGEDPSGLVGRPTPGSEIRIVDGDGRPLDAGRDGEICIRGRHVMQGYLKRPDLNEQVFADGWLRTGDLGHLDDAGRLFIRGRLKDLIRSGGKSVQPQEVEAVLRRHPAVADAAVLGLADEEWGETVAAAVILHAAASVDELLAFCRTQLSTHKRPRIVRILDEFPRSHYGKIQQSRLRQLLSEPETP